MEDKQQAQEWICVGDAPTNWLWLVPTPKWTAKNSCAECNAVSLGSFAMHTNLHLLGRYCITQDKILFYKLKVVSHDRVPNSPTRVIP